MQKYDSGTLKTPECKNAGYIHPYYGVKREEKKNLKFPSLGINHRRKFLSANWGANFINLSNKTLFLS